MSSMAPPPVPRRIVVDQYGNRYYSARAESVYGDRFHPYPRPIFDGPDYELSTRKPSFGGELPRSADQPPRSASLIPRGSGKQLAEVEYIDQPARIPREYSVRPAEPVIVREEYLPAHDGYPPPRYSVHEDGRPLRDYPSRSYSLRPDVIRRDPADPYITRHESIQPGREYVRRIDGPPPLTLREASVHRSEYAPGEDRRSGFVPSLQQRQYLDDRELVDGPADMGHDRYGREVRRVSYRY
jgi:NADH:ubiquinone oxidoreductase subunit